MREAIILAGGLGTRMGGNALSGPKWLTPIGNTTIALHQLAWLARNGVEKVYVTLSERFRDYYLPIAAQAHPLPRHQEGVQDRLTFLQILWEERPIGDEGGLKLALGHLLGDEAVVLNCDVLTNLPLESLPSAPALVVVHPRSPWGVLDPVTMRFEEKPLLDIWVSAGIYRFPKAIREELADEGEIARRIVPRLLAGRRLSILHYTGSWMAVETQKDINEAKLLCQENA